MDVTTYHFSVEADITLQRAEVAAMMRCRFRHREQLARWATSPTGFIYQASQELNAKPEKTSVTLKVTDHQLNIIQSLLENGEQKDPHISELKRRTRSILEGMQGYNWTMPPKEAAKLRVSQAFTSRRVFAEATP